MLGGAEEEEAIDDYKVGAQRVDSGRIPRLPGGRTRQILSNFQPSAFPLLLLIFLASIFSLEFSHDDGDLVSS